MLLYIIAALLALAAYQLAFKKTIDSFTLNKNLKQQVAAPGQMASGTFNKDTDQRLNTIIQKYSVDSAEWENDFWFTVSDIAAKRNIAVVYERAKEPGSDSLTVIGKQVQFSGNYISLIQILDSLETNGKAGFLAGVELKTSESGSLIEFPAIVAKSEFRVIRRKD